MKLGTPVEYTAAVEAERAALWQIAARARILAEAGDQPGLRALAGEARARIRAAAKPTSGWIRGRVDDITAALDEVYDTVFPVRDPGDPADVLDTEWWTQSRLDLLRPMVDETFGAKPDRASLVDQAIAEKNIRLLRLLVVSPVGCVRHEAAVRALDALDGAGELDAAFAERVLRHDIYLAHVIFGQPPALYRPKVTRAECAATMQPAYDAVLWSLAETGEPDQPMPQVDPSHGLRFVRLVLDWPDDHDGAEHPEAKYLGAAPLLPGEQDELAGYLRGQPREKRLRALRFRLDTGDAERLLPLLGLTGTESLLTLIRGIPEYPVCRQDRAAILAAVAESGPEATRDLLELFPSEIVSAALGWNRTAVHKRVRNNALWGIAAYGMLPLDEHETVQDRYLALRAIAKRGARLGPNRKHSHAAAVGIALDHLAQVTGFPDASRLEWECEARVASVPPPEVTAGGYTASLAVEDADPVIVVTGKGGKRLKSVPKTVREHAGYSDLREHQERLRDQARRMRAGLIERLVATGDWIGPEELSRLRSLPCGDPLLTGLLWQDQAGTIGWFDQVDTSGPLAAVHPDTLYEQGELANWQAEVVRQRVTQPVKQVFRELYLLTPAEREAEDRSRRFAGHTVDGKIAMHLLSGRGWSVGGGDDDASASRPAGPGLAALLTYSGALGYLGLGDAVTGEVCFVADSASGDGRVPLADVPPVAFSEVMRDVDLVVSVAGTEPDGYTSPSRAGSRAQLLATLIDDLGLDQVTVDGTTATVRGTRAAYRVNLTSGSIHLDPGGYLCVVPATFGRTAHRRLFLPFADEDRMTSVILSKVLLLAEDDKITDKAILDQLP